MQVSALTPEYVPLIDPVPRDKNPRPVTQGDASLLAFTPEEIQRNIERWRDHNERIHIVV
jgi:hypothetical protein